MPSIKKQLIIFLLILAGYSIISARDLLFLRSLSITVVCAAAAESLILYFKNKKLSLTESSIISGLITGFVLSADTAWWLLGLASVLAISSKYLLRINRRHIFNPAAFGIFLAILLFRAESEWRETYLWFILVPVGFYFAYKIRKLKLITSYFFAAFLFSGAQALYQKSGLSHIFGIFSYFFIFIMLLEPKTTPVKGSAQIAFGAGVASSIFILSNAGVSFDAELFSLLLLNLFVPFLNKLP